MEFTGEDNQATREQPHAFSRGAVTQEKSLFMYSWFYAFKGQNRIFNLSCLWKHASYHFLNKLLTTYYNLWFRNFWAEIHFPCLIIMKACVGKKNIWASPLSAKSTLPIRNTWYFLLLKDLLPTFGRPWSPAAVTAHFNRFFITKSFIYLPGIVWTWHDPLWSITKYLSNVTCYGSKFSNYITVTICHNILTMLYYYNIIIWAEASAFAQIMC